jgi:hypothetical protein
MLMSGAVGLRLVPCVALRSAFVGFFLATFLFGAFFLARVVSEEELRPRFVFFFTHHRL